MSNLSTIVSVAGASFAASFVEAVEALTVVLAIGLARGWRPALMGAAAALAALALMVAVLGPLIGRIPVRALQASESQQRRAFLHRKRSAGRRPSIHSSRSFWFLLLTQIHSSWSSSLSTWCNS
jgi:hypothetical protein